MAKTNIVFNNNNYSIDESLLSSFASALQSHLSTTMNGSGATITLGGTSYNVDSAKLAAATNAFVSHLGTVAGSGYKVVVNGVEYGVSSDKMAGAVSKLEDCFGDLSKCTITWLDEDGTVLKTEEVPYDTVPSYVPTKEGSTFDKWTPTPVAATGDASYTATWEEVVTGTHGDNVTWTLAGGTLTISGDGEIADASSSNYSWYEHKDAIESVVVEDGITHIGKMAFFYYINLKSIDLPNGLKSIGDQAFTGTALTNVVLPNGLTSVSNAFLSCTTLESIYIPDSVTSIVASAFKGCTALSEVNIPATITTINSNTFENCTSLTSVPIHSGVISIGRQAFKGCTGLTRVTVPVHVTTFGNNVFEGCTGITEAIIENGITTIPAGIFNGCTGLTSISIPSSVTMIDYGAFRSTGLTSIIIPSSVTAIDFYAFYGCSKLTSATFDATSGWYVTKTQDATSGGTALTEAQISKYAATYLASTYYDYFWYRI